MTHAVFVGVAYGASALALAGLVIWILTDQRACRRELAALEEQGIRRRSASAGEDPA